MESINYVSKELLKNTTAIWNELTLDEKKYLEISHEFSKDFLDILGRILDPNSTYSDIYISFPTSDKKIKIK